LEPPHQKRQDNNADPKGTQRPSFTHASHHRIYRTHNQNEAGEGFLAVRSFDNTGKKNVHASYSIKSLKR
jgi:hypothetical protein